MKATELRIGNYVGYGSLHTGIGREKMEYYTVSYLTEMCMFFKESNIGEYYADVQPLLLTEEWLLTFGFEYWGLDRDGYKEYVLYNVIDGTSNFCVALGDNIFCPTIDEDICCWSEFKYVHQLQNLYFALTGEELIIKP